MSLLFKQLKDEISSTYTYIVGDKNTREIAIIDSVAENISTYIDFINSHNFILKYIMETHVHADHITALNQLKKQYPNAEAVVSKQAQVKYVARKVAENDELSLGGVTIQVFETTGHTNDSISFLVAGNRLCTGDCLFIGSCGRTDFQQGSNKEMFQSLTKISQLPNDTLIYPGHDYNNRFVSNLQEELLQNKMLKLLSNYEGFCAELDSWKLPPPKKIQESVPANLIGGIDLFS